MRKYTNILLLSGLALFICAMSLSALKLNDLLAHTDLKDPYRNFDRHELPPFRFVSFELGRNLRPGTPKSLRYSHATKIEQGPERLLYINKKLVDSVHWALKNDTLFVRGADNKVGVDFGAILKCPTLSDVSVSLCELALLGGQYDSLKVRANESSVNLKHANIRALNLIAEATSSFALDTNTTTQRLHLNLGLSCSFSSIDAAPEKFDWVADPTASLQFKGKSQVMVRK